MRSASSNGRGPVRRRRWTGLTALVAVVLVAASGAAASRHHGTAALDTGAAYRSEGVLSAAAGRSLRALHASQWRGGSYVTSTGETVRVFVSPGYPDGDAVGRRWAEFFASLLHGPEIGVMTAYVVTPSELEEVCGSDALGCYGGGMLAFMNETAYGVTPEEVAAHEYGHHVAANRPNPPWRSIDSGPKHWASAESVCRRTTEGTAFPGDQDRNYRLNPGEAFAEVYRALNEVRAGAPSFSWSLVDSSFQPDTAALEAAERDVLAPWARPTTQVERARLGGRRTWSVRVSTPLDGNLVVNLKLPRGALHELVVLGPDGRSVLAKGLWSGAAEKHATATVCGQRSIVVRVTRSVPTGPSGPSGPFSLRVTHD